MAKRDRNIGSALAGLAAIGALGYMGGKGLYKRPGESLASLDDRNMGGDMPTPEADMAQGARTQRNAAGPDDADIARFMDVGTNINPESGQPFSLMAQPSGPTGGGGPAGGNRPAGGGRPPAGQADFTDAAAMFRARERADRGTPANENSGAGQQPRTRAAPQQSQRQPSRQMTRDEMIAQIPTGGYSSAPTPGDGRSVTGNETTRNINNILNAPVTGFMPFGRAASAVGRAGSTSRELGPVAETPLTYLGKSGARPVREAERLEGAASQARLAEGQRSLPAPRGSISGPTKGQKAAEKEQERLAYERRKKALDESDWTGGAIGYKKGGAIKAKANKMASGGMTFKSSSASSRADGIAKKGKTKCKMY
jgi:hypothetical protein